MMWISLPVEENLELGSKAQMNGEEVTIIRQGNHLTYYGKDWDSGDRVLHRCRILLERNHPNMNMPDGSRKDCVDYFCASSDDEPMPDEIGIGF